MKYLSIIICCLFLFLGCKKKDESKDLCSNGFVDIGETGVDCGGACPECPVVFLPDLRMKLNSTNIPFATRSFTQVNNEWFLNFSNDSIQMQLHIGSIIEVDSNYSLQQANTHATINGISYPLITSINSVCAITEQFVDEEKISGQFNVQFYRNGFVDTMKVTSGEFTHLPY